MMAAEESPWVEESPKALHKEWRCAEKWRWLDPLTWLEEGPCGVRDDRPHLETLHYIIK